MMRMNEDDLHALSSSGQNGLDTRSCDSNSMQEHPIRRGKLSFFALRPLLSGSKLERLPGAGPAMQDRAFSSEVDTGSLKKKASNQESWVPFRFNCNGKVARLPRVAAIAAAAIMLSACVSDSIAPREGQAAQDPSAMMRIANAAASFGDAEAAAMFYRRAADLQPDSAEARIGIARALVEQGKIEQAIETLRSAKALEPSNTRIYVVLGRLLVAANRPVEGLAAFDEGLQVDSESIALLIGRGVALDAIGQHRQAQSAYREAMQHDPDNAAARKDLALSLAADGQRDKPEATRSTVGHDTRP